MTPEEQKQAVRKKIAFLYNYHRANACPKIRFADAILAIPEIVILDKARELEKLAGIFTEIESLLDIEESSGWIRISNHADFGEYQSLKQKYLG